jgi:hypothetical protein
MNGTPPREDEPSVVGLRVRPKLAIALFVLLGVSAGVGLWTQSNPGSAPPWVERGAPWLFLVFVVGFAAYRFALVAAGRYSAFKAFFQIFLAALFFMMLLPGSPLAARSPAPSLVALLADPDARVRGLAAEVAGYRRDRASAGGLIGLLDDRDPAVREQAHAALVRLNDGSDVGPGAAAWKERFP